MSYPSKLSLKVIDQWLNYVVSQGECPGFQVSIRKESDLIFNKAYGFADISKKEKYSSSHLGRIASQSKVFTASLALDFASRGLINLQDSVSDFIPELVSINGHKLKKISILTLLTNSSPVIRDSYRNNYWSPTNTFPTATELVDEVANSELAKKFPGQVKYSNVGYALVGHALEKIGRRPFQELICKHLFKQMSGVTITTDYNPISKLATGYIREQIGKRRFKRVRHRGARALAPAAGFCANTSSTTKFFSSLYLEKSVLDRKQTDLLLSVKNPVHKTEDEYGLGTIFTTVKGLSFIGHSGGFPGFSSQTWVNPKMKLTVGFCTNVNTMKTFNFIRGICEIIELVDNVFSSYQKTIISPPMADNYGSTIYVVGNKKAIGLPMSGFLPTEEVMIFNKHAGRFYSDQISGYRPAGEPLEFDVKLQKIIAVRFGGSISFPVK